MAEHRQACRPVDAPFPRKRNDLMACFPRDLLMAAQAEGLDPCLLRISSIVLLGGSEAQPSGTRCEHEPSGCSGSRFEVKRESHRIPMANSCRVGRKVNRQGPRTVKGLLERM